MLKRGIKKVHGVGVNDSSTPICYTVNGVKQYCKYYAKWCNMLLRCYNKNYVHAQQYRDVKVCDSWLIFSYFKEWLVLQESILLKDCSSLHLDKDIANLGAIEYNPENCNLIPNYLNSFFEDRKAARGQYPLGVDYIKKTGKFRARLRNFGKEEHLGSFSNEQDAHISYQSAKLKAIDILILKLKNDGFLNDKILHGLNTRKDILEYQIVNRLLTEGLH